MTHETILLANLTCPNCAADLERAVKKLPGVASAKVHFATGTLEVAYSSSELGAETLEKVIDSFGLGVAARL